MRAADALNDVAFDLVFHAVGIDHETAVVGADDAFHRHLPGGLVDLDFGDDRDIGTGALGQRDAASFGDVAARRRRGRRPLLPARLCRRRLSRHSIAAFVAGQMMQAEFDRIDFQIRGDFVDQRFAGETARDVAGRAQIARCATESARGNAS